MNIRTPSDLGAFVKGSRISAGTTQADLARRAGVARAFVVRLEQGRPTLEVGRVLAVIEALNVSLTAADLETTSSNPEAEALLRSVFESLGGGGRHR